MARMRGDIPGGRMIIFIGVAIIGVLFLTAVFTRSLTPSLETSEKARSSYFAHAIASYIGMLSSMDEGTVERDFGEPIDIQVKRYTWIGTLTHFRARPASYYVEVTVYKESGQKNEKAFSDLEACEAYCAKAACACKSCYAGMCTVAELEKSTTSDAAPFIGFVDTQGGDAVAIEGARFVALKKDFSSKQVTVSKAEKVTFCTEPSEAEVKGVVDAYSAKYGVDKNIVLGVITAESSFRHCIPSSSSGAQGIMQVMPATANYVAQKYLENIDYRSAVGNIKAGILYLHEARAELEKYTQGSDLDNLTAAYYNCGPARIMEIVKAKCVKNEPGCWNTVQAYLDPATNPDGESVCQGDAGRETYNYVRNIFGKYKPCFDKNPGCYYTCFVSACSRRSWEAAA